MIDAYPHYFQILHNDTISYGLEGLGTHVESIGRTGIGLRITVYVEADGFFFVLQRKGTKKFASLRIFLYFCSINNKTYETTTADDLTPCVLRGVW